ncbi:hypothetical protein HDU86_001883 [Geranomyces michiganensis]|nr:hypothetical protein HDU86_001883 [Geranomyces michiganensis]
MADLEDAPALPTDGAALEPRKGGIDYSPANLATEAKKSAQISGWRLPLWAVLLGTFSFIISVIVIPASEVFVTNAHSNVEDTAQVILEISTSKCVGDIKELMTKFEAVAHGFGKRPTTNSVIQGALAGAKIQDQVLNNLDWPHEFTFLMTESYPVTTIACIGNSGPSPSSVVMVAMDFVPIPAIMYPEKCIDAGISTCLYYTNRTYTFDYMDTTTIADGGLTYWKFILDEQGLLSPAWLRAGIYTQTTDPYAKAFIGSPDPREPIKYIYQKPNFYDPSLDPNYQIMQGDNPMRENGSYWKVNILQPTYVLYGSVSKAIYKDERRDAKPTHICQAGGNIATSLSPFLSESVPSAGGIVFLYDTAINADSSPNTTAGAMIASSIPGSDVSSTGIRYTCASSPSELVSEVGKFLLRANPTLNFPGLQTFKTKLADSRTWYIATQHLKVDTVGNSWIVVVAFPREDFFANIDRSIKQSITIIGCLVAAALVMVVLLSFAFTVPLSRLAARMEEVTQMRFSSLKDATLESRSFVKEIASLEQTFHIMVQAFAAGIRKNAGLMSAGHSERSAVRQSASAANGGATVGAFPQSSSAANGGGTVAY